MLGFRGNITFIYIYKSARARRDVVAGNHLGPTPNLNLQDVTRTLPKCRIFVLSL